MIRNELMNRLVEYNKIIENEIENEFKNKYYDDDECILIDENKYFDELNDEIDNELIYELENSNDELLTIQINKPLNLLIHDLIYYELIKDDEFDNTYHTLKNNIHDYIKLGKSNYIVTFKF